MRPTGIIVNAGCAARPSSSACLLYYRPKKAPMPITEKQNPAKTKKQRYDKIKNLIIKCFFPILFLHFFRNVALAKKPRPKKTPIDS